MAFTAPPLASFRPAAAVRQRSAFPAGASHHQKRPANWWAPLFGWSPEPDYITGGGAVVTAEGGGEDGRQPGQESPCGRAGSRRSAAFTEEKARRLRMKTVEGSTFHDAMYHSAIASRLASDLRGRFDQ